VRALVRFVRATGPALVAGVIDKQTVLDESTVRKAIADLDHE
jgi:hypothetical protein